MFPNDDMPRSISIGEIVLQLLIAVTQGYGSYGGYTSREEVSKIIIFGKVLPFSPTLHPVTSSIAVLHLC